jgi:hypothetical protein
MLVLLLLALAPEPSRSQQAAVMLLQLAHSGGDMNRSLSLACHALVSQTQQA